MHKIKITIISGLLVLSNILASSAQSEKSNQINLAGQWSFRIDSLDEGVSQKWFAEKLEDKIKLPGSLTTNGKGNDITLNTPWTGQILDSSWFKDPEYAPFRTPGNIKVPFWLQPVKYYKGAAWYQHSVTIPDSWKGKYIELYIERSHWETTVWVDEQRIGMQNSLGTPHIFDLSNALKPGAHRLTIRIDNRVKDFNVGQNSHSISDHTQSNWNGMIGDLLITARPSVYIANVKLYPDIKKKEVVVRLSVNNQSGKPGKITLNLQAASTNPQAEKLPAVTKEINIKVDSSLHEFVYPMGNDPLLWEEFHPNLYKMTVSLTSRKSNTDVKTISFGMRDFSVRGTQFAINGDLTFLRGTLECAIFPETGFPPTKEEEWTRIFNISRAYGLNHLRFHSWCPPEAAFNAADSLGFYLQVECSSWANQGSSLGDGKPIDQYIYDESNRVVNTYGNHPSFVLMTYGNEPGGKNHVKYLTDFVNYWKKKDPRRLYTSGAGWPAIPDNDYNNVPEPRIQHWGAGLKSIINSKPPSSDYDWSDAISKWSIPTVSHEIGQWCVYPDLKEVTQYDGVLKAKNFEVFKATLEKNGLAHLADSFLLASGKLQVLCYKADIEAALRTPGFGGFQLLDLHDFPGQGTALVGVLNPFWREKGYVTGEEYSRFCNSTVPLARLPKMIYLNDETLAAPIEIAHFGEAPLKDVTPAWNIKDPSGKILFQGTLKKVSIPVGNDFKLGEITQSLRSIEQPSRLTLTVSVADFQNSWDLFIYPATLPSVGQEILVTQQFDAKAMAVLDKGGKVLLTVKKGSVQPEKGGNVQVGFSSIFWNTAWTKKQAPHTLGILCNPDHPALSAFPTEYHSNWQWWDAMSHSNAIRLDAIDAGLQPIVRVIDDWVTARPLGLIFECAVGKGKLLVSGIDLMSDQDKRPEARQLLFSLKNYMMGDKFTPKANVTAEAIKDLLVTNP